MKGLLGIFGSVAPSKGKPRFWGSSLFRRKNARYPAGDNEARLCWWDGGEYHEASARLVNVSQGGALVSSPESPPKDRPVYLRLMTPEPTDWVELKVVRDENTREVGTAFTGSCPYELYKAVTLVVNESEIERPEGPEFDSRHWR